MEGSPRISARRRMPWALVGMLALVLLVETYVDRHGLKFMDSFGLDWKASGRHATEQRAARCDVLCFGDSMLKFGIAPRVLEAMLKRPNYSLALLDGKPPASYFMLRRAVAAGARPSAVLVDFPPEMVSQPGWHLLENPRWNSGTFSLVESLDLAWNYRDPDFFARLVLARHLPTYRSRGEVRANVMAALDGQDRPTRETNAPVRRNAQVNKGGLLLARQPGYQGDVPPQMIGSLCSPEWTIEPANVRYIRRFVALAAAHKVPVFWDVPPNAPVVVAQRTENGLHARYDAFVREILGQFENLRVIDARRSGFAHTVFVDPVHLDRQGATALTAAVAGVLRDAPAPGVPKASRWIDLPAYREPPVKLKLEDVEQSKAALRVADADARVRR